MKKVAAFVVGVGLIVATMAGFGNPSAIMAQEKKDEKKEDKKEPKKKEEPKAEKKVDLPALEGKYQLTSGKVNDKAVDDAAKKWNYSITGDSITIAGSESRKKEDGKKKDEKPLKFVFSYKLDASATPIQIDMAILDGPEGTKGSKAMGIVEVKGDVLKLAYSMEKDKRPKNFDGKEGNAFELKKTK